MDDDDDDDDEEEEKKTIGKESRRSNLRIEELNQIIYLLYCKQVQSSD